LVLAQEGVYGFKPKFPKKMGEVKRNNRPI